MTHTAAIIIPLYKQVLSPLEEISLNQCFKILSKHKIIAVKPENLSLDQYNFQFDKVLSFDDGYFENPAGYNRLMLSASFYKQFLAYKFILIYQPDAFVFQDDLLYWCNTGYDYIGAPWLKGREYSTRIKAISKSFLKHLHVRTNRKQPGTHFPTELQFENNVGNGGLSLRNTKKFYEICSSHRKVIDYYNSQPEYYFGEDVFWSIEANRKKKYLNIPGHREAACFSMESNIDFAFRLTKGKLPFGCHAWDRNLDDWRPFFKQVNVTI